MRNKVRVTVPAHMSIHAYLSFHFQLLRMELRTALPFLLAWSFGGERRDFDQMQTLNFLPAQTWRTVPRTLVLSRLQRV